VVVAPGHSSRALLTQLQDAGVRLVPKPFALGMSCSRCCLLVNTTLHALIIANRRLRVHWFGSSADPFGISTAGFRVEHPQTFIDSVQYGERDAGQVQRGRGRIPVADYRLAASVRSAATVSPALASWGEAPDSVPWRCDHLRTWCQACLCCHSCCCTALQRVPVRSNAPDCRANRANQHFRGRALCQRHVLQVRCSEALLLTGASRQAKQN